jgi:hypothetical protein
MFRPAELASHAITALRAVLDSQLLLRSQIDQANAEIAELRQQVPEAITASMAQQLAQLRPLLSMPAEGAYCTGLWSSAAPAVAVWHTVYAPTSGAIQHLHFHHTD